MHRKLQCPKPVSDKFVKTFPGESIPVQRDTDVQRHVRVVDELGRFLFHLLSHPLHAEHLLDGARHDRLPANRLVEMLAGDWQATVDGEEQQRVIIMLCDVTHERTHVGFHSFSFFLLRYRVRNTRR